MVLVPTVWNCMRFYTEGKRNGYRKAENAVLRMPRNPEVELTPIAASAKHWPHETGHWAAEANPDRAAAPRAGAGVSGCPVVSRPKSVSGQCRHLPS